MAKHLCPECGSDRLYKDGLRYTKEGQVQRYLCRACGRRFSQPKVKVNVTGKVGETFNSGENNHKKRVVARNRSVKEASDNLPFLPSEDIASHTASNLTVIEKGLNSLPYYNSKRKYAPKTKGAKNLTFATKTKTVAGDLEKLPEQTRGLITQFYAYMEKEGYPQESEYPGRIKTLVRRGADLLNPESVKAVVGKQKIKNGSKLQYIAAYALFAKMLKISWEPPRYKQEECLPFIPDEKELDCLIAACLSKRMAAYLQTLKETFADPGEARKLRWIDVNEKDRVITINNPVKGH